MPEYKQIMELGSSGVVLVAFVLLFWRGIPALKDYLSILVANFASESQANRTTFQQESQASRSTFQAEMTESRNVFTTQIQAERDTTILLIRGHSEVIRQNTTAVEELRTTVGELKSVVEDMLAIVEQQKNAV